MDVGHILAALRTQRGIYQKEIALYLNVSIGTVSNYEKNIHYPDLDTLSKLADYYGVTADYILGRSACKCSNDSLNRSIAKDYTIGDLINTVMELSPDDINCLIDYLSLLKMRSNFISAQRISNEDSTTES